MLPSHFRIFLFINESVFVAYKILPHKKSNGEGRIYYRVLLNETLQTFQLCLETFSYVVDKDKIANKTATIENHSGSK